MGVEGAPVERGLPALSVGRVGNDGVGVQLRIAGTRGPMTERRDREAVAAEQIPAVRTAARPGGVAFEIAERFSDRLVMCVSDDGGDGSVTDAVDDRDRLRGGERQVIGQDGLRSGGGRAGLGEEIEELLVLDAAGQASTLGAAAFPLPLGLAVAGVVVVLAGGDVVDVVARITRAAAHFADGEHAPLSTRRPDPPRVHSQNAGVCRSWWWGPSEP
ncbi:MAG TPA: hypothetical protein VK501_22845 [Baekduia sp.]|nr:hypothetical protein [Baekduia sp.]